MGTAYEVSEEQYEKRLTYYTELFDMDIYSDNLIKTFFRVFDLKESFLLNIYFSG